MHARLDRGAVRLLTRNGLDWTHKYPQIAAAVAALPARQAYLDGELCGVRPDGITSFSMIQLASDAGNAAGLVFFLFDLLYLDGEDLTARPLIERKERLAGLLSQAGSPLHYSDHQIGLGPAFYEKACAMSLKRANCKERHKDVYDRLVAEWQAWNASMLPEIAESFTKSFTGEELADHYGAQKPVGCPIPSSIWSRQRSCGECPSLEGRSAYGATRRCRASRQRSLHHPFADLADRMLPTGGF